MPIISLTFDDPEEEDLTVFSGQDLLTAHYDQIDLDWEEVAERALIDERRGLVITQVSVLDDLIDEFIIYLVDPVDAELYRREHLDRVTTGPRLKVLEDLLRAHELLNVRAVRTLADLRAVVNMRNQLAHGTIHRQPVRIVPIKDLATSTIEMEWVLTDRRDRKTERVSMTGLKSALRDAQGCFMGLLAFAESFVEVAPRPKNYRDGWYLAAPTS